MPTKKLTARGVASLKAPPTGQVDYWDADFPRFGVRITSKGKKVFVVMFRAEGKKWRYTIGAAPDWSLADAREKAKDILREVRQGKNPAVEKRERAKAETFEELVSDYVERYAKRSKSSWRQDERILQKDFIPKLGRRKAADVTRREIKNILEDIVARGAPVGANRALEVIRKLYYWAVSQEIVPFNPIARFEKPGGKERSRSRVLRDEELVQLWTRLDGAGMTTSTRLALRFAMVTAQRKKEVAGASLDEFNEAERTWTIPAARMKTRKPHVVPLSQLAMDLLAEIKEANGGSRWLFPSPRTTGSLRPSALDQALLLNRQIIEIDGLVPHDLRRTASTTMGRFGFNRFIQGKVLGHVDSTTTGKHYDMWEYLPEKRAALEAWSRHLKALISGEELAANVIPLARPA